MEAPLGDFSPPKNSEISTKKTQVSSPKRGKKRYAKKVRPEVHPLFTGRGARDLFHEERGYVRCWMDLHPQESQRDIAARFNVGPGVIAGLLKSGLCVYEESLQAKCGRRPQHAESIRLRLEMINELREDYESPAKTKARLEANGIKVSLSTIKSDFRDLGLMAKRKLVSPWRGGDPEAWAARRLAFCKEVKALGEDAVASICFSDESIIRCTTKGEFCWCKDDELTEEIEINRWAANCHVWACIGRDNFLVWVDVSGENLKAVGYQNFCKKEFRKPYLAQKKAFKQPEVCGRLVHVSSREPPGAVF